MACTIGGMTIQQYHSLLMLPSYKRKEGEKFNRKKTKEYLLKCHDYLQVVINRCVYLIFTRFAHIPSNRYLFEQFKKHQFNQIQTVQDCEEIKKIIRRFQLLGQFDEELHSIEEQLNQIKQTLEQPITIVIESSKVVESDEEMSVVFNKPSSSTNVSLTSLLQELCEMSNLLKNGDLSQRKEKYKQDKQINSSCAITPFDTSLYCNLVEDQKNLDNLFKFFFRLTLCYNSYKELLVTDRGLRNEELNLTRTRLIDIYIEFEQIIQMLTEVYSQNQINLDLINQINHLRKSLYQDLNQPKKLESSYYLFPFFNKPSQDDIEWKIKKYEVLFLNLYNQFDEYLKKMNLPSIAFFIQKAEDVSQQKEIKKWEEYLIPIFETLSHCLKLERERMTSSYLDSLRFSYKEGLVKKLREAARWAQPVFDDENKEQVKEGAEYLDAICACFYTQTNLNDYCKSIITTFNQLGSWATKNRVIHKKYELSDPNYYLIKDLETIDWFIYEAPLSAKASPFSKAAKSMIDHLNGLNESMPFDSNLSNPIHIFMDLIITKNGRFVKRVRDIAMGTPTIEYGGKQLAEIAPEFLAYQRHNQRIGQKQLYFNHQDFRNKARLKGNESTRCQLIHNISTMSTLSQTFFAVTFNKNTAFYNQEDHIYHSNAKIFKDHLLTQFFDLVPAEGGNYIPPTINEPLQLKDWAKTKMIPKTHEILFENRLELTKEEMKVWIELTDIQLSIKLIIELLVDYYNKSCKDRIDRGAVADALLFIYLVIINHQEDNVKVKDFLEMMLLSRTLMVRKREIKKERLERFIETAKWMLDHKNLIRKLHEELFSGWSVTTDKFLDYTRQEKDEIKDSNQLISEFEVLLEVSVKT